MSDDWRGYSLPNGYLETMKHIAARMEAAEAKLAAIEAICHEADEADHIHQWGDHTRGNLARMILLILKEKK